MFQPRKVAFVESELKAQTVPLHVQPFAPELQEVQESEHAFAQ